MKRIFRFKLENFNVVMSIIGIILSYSLHCDSSDWRAKAIMLFCGLWFVLAIFSYNTIKEFRQEVYRRW